MAKTKKTEPEVKELISKVGRPTLYKPEFCEEIIKFFDVEPYRDIERVHEKSGNLYTERIANKLPTLAGFARHIGVCRRTLNDWCDAHPEFLHAVTRAKAMTEDMLVTNSLLGLFNPTTSIFVMKNYTDMRDVKDVNVNDTRKPPPQSTKEIDERIRELQEEESRLEAML